MLHIVKIIHISPSQGALLLNRTLISGRKRPAMLPSVVCKTSSPNRALYSARARTIPPIIAKLPAICVAAAFVLTGVADEVELCVAVALVLVPVVVELTLVKVLEPEDERVEDALVEFPVALETTVLVEDGTEEVEVLVVTVLEAVVAV